MNDPSTQQQLSPQPPLIIEPVASNLPVLQQENPRGLQPVSIPAFSTEQALKPVSLNQLVVSILGRLSEEISALFNNGVETSGLEAESGELITFPENLFEQQPEEPEKLKSAQ